MCSFMKPKQRKWHQTNQGRKKAQNIKHTIAKMVSRSRTFIPSLHSFAATPTGAVASRCLTRSARLFLVPLVRETIHAYPIPGFLLFDKVVLRYLHIVDMATAFSKVKEVGRNSLATGTGEALEEAIVVVDTGTSQNACSQQQDM